MKNLWKKNRKPEIKWMNENYNTQRTTSREKNANANRNSKKKELITLQ